jgi:hypothetical protein
LKSALGKQFMRPYLENNQYKAELAECETLNSNPSTTKKKINK